MGGYYLLNNKCSQTCDKGFYANSETSRCVECAIECVECRGNNIVVYYFSVYLKFEKKNHCKSDCSVCREGFFFKSPSTCTNDCGLGFFANENTQACDKCSERCS